MEDTMISTRELPWMKLGTVIDKPMTPDEALVKANLNWTVDKHPLFVRNLEGDLTEVADRYAMMRSSDGRVLGVVGSHYETYQNHEAFAFLSELVDEPDDAIIEAAGSVRDGRQVFMVVKFPSLLGDVLDGDDHDLYAIVRTGHDGTKAVQVMVMPLRLKCMNMLGLSSFGRDAQQRWSLQHVSTLSERLAEARDTLARVDRYAEEYARTAERLAAIDIEEQALRDILDRVLPQRPKTGEVIDGIVSRFHESPTIDDRFRGTAYGAINAVTEHMDWGRARMTDEGRYHSVLDGTSARVRNRATALLLAR